MSDKNEIAVEGEGGKLLFTNRYLLKLLWPLFVEQLLVYAVGLADSVMVASVGEEAVSAVSLVDSVMVLVITIFIALSTGGAVVVGQYLGQQKEKDANRAADQLVLFVVLFSFLVIAIMYVFRTGLMHLIFGEIEDEVMDNCNTYYMIVVASIPFIAISNAGSALFRSVGNSNISMRASIVMNVVNIGGNALLLYGFGMGIAGVAIPTLACRIVAAGIMLFLLKNQDRKVHLSRKFVLIPDWGLIRKILKIGVPNGIENSMFQLGKLILLSMISGFGTASITANAVANTASLIAVLPGMAMGYGVVSVISICVGAGDYRQVRFYARKLIKWVYGIMIITNVVMILAIPLILNIYDLSQETADIAGKLIFVNCAPAVFIWPLSFTVPNVLRAAGDVMYTMVVGVASMWIFRIFFGVFLGEFVGIGVLGVWIAMVVDWAIRSICFCIRYRGSKWKREAVV